MIFRDTEGSLEFVGNFEALYQSEGDPWGQSGESQCEMSTYYNWSRRKLNEILLREVLQDDNFSIEGGKVLEIGCGLGYTTSELCALFPDLRIVGCDVSESAVFRARELFPDVSFLCSDILESPICSEANVLVVSNMIWYVLHEFDKFMENVVLSVDRSNNKIVIYNSIFKTNQRYGSDKVESLMDVYNLFSNVYSLRSMNFYKFNDRNIKYDFEALVMSVDG